MKKITSAVNYYICLFAILVASSLLAQSTANYNVSVTTSWNASDHGSMASPNNLPDDPHWSPLALVTHKNSNEFMEVGALSSLGVQNIAETGNTSNFQNEFNIAKDAGNADQYFQSGFSPRGAISTASIDNITISEAYPLVTFLSMIAPSPDWFIGVNSETLRSGNISINNGWKNTYSMDLFVYDAGTDDGLDYQSSNAASNPKVGIFKINTMPINGIKVATATFTLNSTLSSATFENETTFQLYPNPITNGKVSISNFNNKAIQTIEIYSVLGKLVKRSIIANNNSTIQLNVSELNGGIYIVRIQSKSGYKLSQKLIIK
jgi:hypothetical protein